MHTDFIRFRTSLVYTIAFVGFLWLVKAIETLLSFDLGILGIHPRSLAGTVGIITGPLVHGDFHHLMSNTLSLIILGVGVFYFYHRIALKVFIGIYFFTSLWVWILARDAYHIGASGIVYGLASFLLFSGFFRKDSRSIAISLIVIFLYGGMVYGLFPVNEEVSWESHLLGSIVGFLAAFIYRKHLSVIQLHSITEEPSSSPDEVPFSSTTYHHTAQNKGKELQYFYKQRKYPEQDDDTEKLTTK